MNTYESGRSAEMRPEQGIRRRLAELEAVFAASPVLFWYKDCENKVVRINPAAAAAEGARPDEVEGRSCWDLYPRDQAEAFYRDDLEVIQTRKPKLNILEQHTAIGTRELRWMQVGKVPLIDDDGKVVGVLAFATDITERMRFEERVRHTEKLEAVGRLAGGVAHDFNNLLAGIIGNAELLSRYLPNDDVHQSALNSIRDAAERAAELTRQLLLISRKAEHRSEVLDVHRVTEAVAALLRRTCDKRIVIQVSLEAELPYVRGDAALLHSALLNLGLNARDEMPQGGQLVLRSHRARLDAARPCGHGQELSPGTYLVLSVSDDGHGIHDSDLRHLFEPFFTTKAPGRGTGLGLASVFATVREHLGAVTVDSVVGKGSTFALWLPAVEESPHAADPAATPRGRGHLLLVDDEPSLREVGAKLLHELGYTVDVAPDGVGAIAKIALGPDSYCAVLLDVMMPLMSGSDVYERIQALAPRLPVIIVSGYGAQAEMLLARGVAAVLPKPYTLSQLAQTLSRVLVGPTAPR